MKWFRRRETELPDELVRSSSMDNRFRQFCAVFESGRCLIAEGYEEDPRLRATLEVLARAGELPEEPAEEIATVEEIAACWQRAAPARPDGADPEVLNLVRRLFTAAANARASDVIFDDSHGRVGVFVIVNDRKLPLDLTMTTEQGRSAMGYLFHSKDEGSAQTSYQRQSFQGFSIRGGGQVPLPPSISALRCQRGPHEPAADHLFARIFYRDTLDEGMTLERLGFSPEECAVFAEVRASMHGGIFIGGSTGDGKSTTLATNLTLQMAEMGEQLNVVTLEDPVEYPIPGAIQIAVPTTGAGEERGQHFARALMHFCRVHPASGMVSEIRDADAARQVLQFVSTGHQVWTTIHTHSANSILFRLIDLGVTPAELCKPGSVVLLMKQTLLPELCSFCAKREPPGTVPAWLAARLRSWPGARFRNPEGCPACSRADRGPVAASAWNGYVRQAAIAEIILPDERYLECVRTVDPAGAWNHWIAEMGGKPLGPQIWERVKQGLADPRDALFKGARPEQADEVGLKVVTGDAA